MSSGGVLALAGPEELGASPSPGAPGEGVGGVRVGDGGALGLAGDPLEQPKDRRVASDSVATKRAGARTVERMRRGELRGPCQAS